MERNSRILDLREKLNKINERHDQEVDRKSKGLINGMTQLVDDKEQGDSGPYSLLFDLQPDSSKSQDNFDVALWKRPQNEDNTCITLSQKLVHSAESINKCADRLPNVLNFEDKPMREFEYSCENEVKKTFNTHSRSDLCLQLKSHINNRTYETNLSPNDNSLNRTEDSLDDSLGILTPDQMDDICYLDNAFSPTVEGLPIFCDSTSKVSPDNGDTPSTDKTESNSAASTIQNDGFEITHRISNVTQGNLAPIATLDTVNDDDQILEDDTLDNHQMENSIDPVGQDSSICPKILKNIIFKDNVDEYKNESFPNLLEDEFMPSIHSSILEPVSSVAETTVNLDLPLDCKHETRLVIQRIEQTPSPEDLPLDSSDINGEISSYSQFSGSTLHDSNTYSDAKNDYPKSMETSKVSNSFITSITSITSLDGYQGDGEMSRPVSRAADHSIEPREDAIEMDWQNVPVARRTDPMTDSDFFTESDADGLDDTMQRGDRRAQVIDGALYGGKNGNGNPPLIVNRNDDSCMESSGVYTDFENHRSSPVFLNVIDDMSPDGSSPSTRSECSFKHASNGKINAFYTPLDETLKEDKSNESHVLDEETPKVTSKRNSLNNEKEVRTNEKGKEKKRSFTLKKYEMPRRDVPSKLKSLLSNRKTDADSVQSSPKIVKKNDRREISKKNGLELKSDYKTKSFKDIKSKVDCSFTLQRSQTSCSVTRMLSSKANNNSKPKSRHMRMRMELGSVNGSGKSSLHSSQSDISATSSPLGKHPTSRFPLRNGKKRDSAPVSTPARPPAAIPPPPTAVPAKKNGVVQKLSSSPVSVRSRTSLAPPPSPRKPAPRRTAAQRPTTLPTCKEPPRVTAAVGPRGKRVQTPQARGAPGPLPAPPPASHHSAPHSAELAHATKGFEALGVLVQYLVFRLDALNGDTWRLEAERWRSVAAAERSSAARADRDRQQRAQKDLDTIAECLSKISELEVEVSSKEEENARLQAARMEEVAVLANDIKELKDTIECLKREVSESRARLHAHSEMERTLRAQLEAARLDGRPDRGAEPRDKSCDMCDAACDPVCCDAEQCELTLSANEELSSDANELAAEVRSLRAVVELKQAEVVALRGARAELAAERERRAAAEREARAARHAAEELRERARARQRDVDALRDDNRKLREIAARDRDHASRLAALNEEYIYKLRTKSQVASLLASNGYAERGVRARTASSESCVSGRSSPESPPPAAPGQPGADALPAVKGVVEKHDSVSWVLEIEESAEEMASRLARKSSFRNSGAGSGVKRRGTGSPGGSPAPASPAPNASKLFRPGELDFPPAPTLKESAGEAIYIYDDHQY